MRNNRSTILQYLIIFLVAFVANICAADEEVEQQPMSLEVQARWTIKDGPDDVYIRVSETLDEPRYYCLDIPGNNEQLVGIQVSLHTCKEGMQHRDVIFSSERTANGE